MCVCTIYIPTYFTVGVCVCDLLPVDLFTGGPCASHEIFYLPPPGILASKFLVQQSYPIVEENTSGELTCFGP